MKSYYTSVCILLAVALAFEVKYALCQRSVTICVHIMYM